MSAGPQVKKLSLTENLDILIKKRNGGAVNFRGIQYQVLYSCHLILKNLWNPNSDQSITLEGLEDLDHRQTSVKIDSAEFIQLKSSENKINAGDFWTMGVLQNFLQVYLSDNNSRFRLVYNFKTADGALRHLFEKKLTPDAFAYWKSKLVNYSNIPFNVKDFLEKVSYERIALTEITESITKLLFKHWNVNSGTERQFLNALAYSVLEWSKARETIANRDVIALFYDVAHSYSKAVQNEAVKNSRIEAVDYAAGISGDLLSYYDGKAARPHHIAAGMPAERKYWETKIIESLSTDDIVLIRSSSGQGKSTLAWRAGYVLSEKYSVYQLHSVKTWEQANSSLEFLQSRITLGELPLVILDGLDAEMEQWQALVQRTAFLPIKYILTSRHEDWSRYGADISAIKLIPMDISMSRDEAENIFSQLKTGGKLHPEIKDWQPVWEQVLEKGLLIEYTYLLTKGEMINERLTKQIQKLKDDRAPAAKTEILRIVAAADCLYIRIDTQKLVSYITATVTFAGQDRGEVLGELQDEYFINFEGQKIEGLHPVRSLNLLSLLHQSLPLSETFINLYQLVEPQDKQDFFRHVMLNLDKQQRNIFYKGIAKVLASAPYTEMVYALNGISYAEPQKYWLDNKAQFDEIFESGGLDLFIIETIPGKAVNVIDGIIKTMPEHLRANLIRQREILRILPKYGFSQTDLSTMASELLDFINSPNPFKPSYIGLGHLAKWYMKLDLKLDLKLGIESLAKSLAKLSLEEIKGLFQFAQLSDPGLYKEFVYSNKAEIINYLRKNTDSFSIKENENHIVITYIYDADSADTIVQQALKKIESVYNLLPYYKKYDTRVLMLPYPSEHVISVMKSDGEKSMSPENIPDTSEALYSRIWIDTISRNYEESSAYQWQKNILEIRRKAADWCISALKIIEVVYEGDQIKRDNELPVYATLTSELHASLTPVKAYPKYAAATADKSEKTKSEKSVNDWFFTLRNASSQFFNLLAPTGENSQNLASINLKALFFKLEQMQAAFHCMEKFTDVHFDSLKTDKNEKIIYERLYKSVLYAIKHSPVNEQIPVRSTFIAIEQWYSSFIETEMSDLKKILEQASSIMGCEFIIPKRLQKTETISTVVIGVRNFDLARDNGWLVLAGALAGFAEYPAVFVTVIAVNNGIAAGALRFKRDFFAILNNYDDTRLEELLDNQPLPINLDQEHASILGITVREQDPKSPAALRCRIFIDFWKMSKIKSVLDADKEFDRQWLEELEQNHKTQTAKNLKQLLSDGSDTVFTNWINSELQSGSLWSDQKTIEEITKVTFQATEQPD
jgi:hypothetical protein